MAYYRDGWFGILRQEITMVKGLLMKGADTPRSCMVNIPKGTTQRNRKFIASYSPSCSNNEGVKSANAKHTHHKLEHPNGETEAAHLGNTKTGNTARLGYLVKPAKLLMDKQELNARFTLLSFVNIQALKTDKTKFQNFNIFLISNSIYKIPHFRCSSNLPYYLGD